MLRQNDLPRIAWFSIGRNPSSSGVLKFVTGLDLLARDAVTSFGGSIVLGEEAHDYRIAAASIQNQYEQMFFLRTCRIARCFDHGSQSPILRASHYSERVGYRCRVHTFL